MLTHQQLTSSAGEHMVIDDMERMIKSGFVHIETNEAMPSFVRVILAEGLEPLVTETDPQVFPLPFRSAARYRICDLAELERALAVLLAQHRCLRAPDFYRISAEQMCAAVELVAAAGGPKAERLPAS